jgi:cob(I)alamin adenosyltransferase
MKFQKLFALVLCLGLLLSFVGCAASNDMAYEGDFAYGSAAPEASYDSMNTGSLNDYVAKEDSATEAGTSLPENRKLIQTVRMSVETEDLDSVLQQINSRISELAGYVESSDVHNGSAYSGKRYRDAEMTIRIPADKVDSFVDKVGEVSNIVSSNKSVEDITLSYVATESRMNALKTEESRLLELMAQAETMDDLLTIESRLTDVRTELEQVTSALKVFDNQVDYATIHLSIEEVKEYTEVKEPETVWERIGTGFMKSLKGVGNFFVELFVFLIVASPYLALIAGFILVFILIIRFLIWICTRKSKKNAPVKKPVQTPPAPPVQKEKPSDTPKTE